MAAEAKEEERTAGCREENLVWERSFSALAGLELDQHIYREIII